MAYTLDTGHALYANLIELIGVQAGALVSHKTARTFTKHADATYGSGPWGEHFTSVNGGYTAKGASFTPGIAVNTYTTPIYTTVAVFNATGTSTGGSVLSRTTGGAHVRGPGKDSSGNLLGYRCTGATIGTGQRMLTFCRIGETAAKLYNNTVQDFAATGLGADYNDPGSMSDYLLGWEGQNAIGASLVWLAIFNRELTSTEISDLYASLGASNAFGLVSTGGGGPANLVVADGTHSHPADNIVLTTLKLLAISDANHTHSTDSIILTAITPGTITIPAVRDWGTKVLKSGATGIQVDIRNIATGALVVRKTNQTTHATTGVCVVADTAIVAGTTYEVVTRFADGSIGVWDYAAT